MLGWFRRFCLPPPPLVLFRCSSAFAFLFPCLFRVCPFQARCVVLVFSLSLFSCVPLFASWLSKFHFIVIVISLSFSLHLPRCGGACVCVYTVITNGFSSFHCSCTILKSRGQRYPCHFLCQRSWVTCGKDIDQGRLIYVPAIVSTVDFLFLFMSCALFLRSGTCVR